MGLSLRKTGDGINSQRTSPHGSGGTAVWGRWSVL